LPDNQHTYGVPYTIDKYIIIGAELSDGSMAFSYVKNPIIIADFTWTDLQCGGNTILFTEEATGETPTSWTWSVDGVETFTGANEFSYTFPEVTTETVFDVSLLVETESDADDEITKQITIYPSYLIEESHTICDGESYTWHGTDYTEPGTYTAEYECVNTG